MARAGINIEVQLHNGCTSEEYLQKLHQSLDSAFSQFEPHLVIHNAGSDIMVGDPLGMCAATSLGCMHAYMHILCSQSACTLFSDFFSVRLFVNHSMPYLPQSIAGSRAKQIKCVHCAAG